MTRAPATPEYDAVVGLEPKEGGQSPSHAYAIVKRTYDVTPAGLAPAESEPLTFDIYGEERPSPPLPSGSDYWVTKRATDVVILGAAFTPGGKPARAMQVSASVGGGVTSFGLPPVARSASANPSGRESLSTSVGVSKPSLGACWIANRAWIN